ncbi:SGNH/GDSL hydrolase family protein [Flindersiella endophytica]
MPAIKPDARVLFIGDSITDAGRDRADPDSLGDGYVADVARSYSGSDGVRFLNRGISGNRVRDLKARWQSDCLDLEPDLLSIMIGVNDTWRRYDKNDPTTADAFEADLDAILAQVHAELPDTRLVVLEPFLLPVSDAQALWREDFDPKLAAVRHQAVKHSATLVPLDAVLTEAATKSGPAALAHDGVHPTPEGHALIAGTWLSVVTGQ